MYIVPKFPGQHFMRRVALPSVAVLVYKLALLCLNEAPVKYVSLS